MGAWWRVGPGRWRTARARPRAIHHQTPTPTAACARRHRGEPGPDRRAAGAGGRRRLLAELRRRRGERAERTGVRRRDGPGGAGDGRLRGPRPFPADRGRSHTETNAGRGLVAAPRPPGPSWPVARCAGRGLRTGPERAGCPPAGRCLLAAPRSLPRGPADTGVHRPHDRGGDGSQVHAAGRRPVVARSPAPTHWSWQCRSGHRPGRRLASSCCARAPDGRPTGRTQ